MKSFINITKSYMDDRDHETTQFQIIFYLMLNQKLSLNKKYLHIRDLKKKKVNITAYNYFNNIYYGLTIVHILAILNMSKEIFILELTDERLDLPSLDTNKTPLDLAIEYYSYDAIKYLIKSEKININNGYLIKCVKQNIPFSVIKFLVSFGANINEKDYQGNNALYYAYISNQSILVSYLKNKGAIYDETYLQKLKRKYTKIINLIISNISPIQITF